MKGKRKPLAGVTWLTGGRLRRKACSASLSARLTRVNSVYGKAGARRRPSRDRPWCKARQKSSAVQAPRPVLGSGVKLPA